MNFSPVAALVGGLLLSLVVVAAWWVLFRPKPSAEELEWRRRQNVYLNGRIRDAEVTEVRDWIACYTYSAAGVTYSAAQDISMFRESLPADAGLLLGPAGVKYLPKNPVNSIVICEQWVGLRIPPANRPATGGELVPQHDAEQA
ncbi:MAG: hypothetical protein IT160_10200 [Bryobacterales bacterium]|nr:hypothetical protein [Bryobacterales bacterium]